MTTPPVMHYVGSDGPFASLASCRPFLLSAQLTTRREAVTCRACLRKLEKHVEKEEKRGQE